MKEKVQKLYFVIWKMIGFLMLILYRTLTMEATMMERAIHGLYLTCFMAFSMGLELTNTKKNRILILSLEGILSVVGVFLFPVSGVVLGMFFWSDLCGAGSKSIYWYLLGYLWLIPYDKLQGELLSGFCLDTLILAISFQEKQIVEYYRTLIGVEEETQMELKTDIEKQHVSHQEEMKKSHLRFENQILEERNRISQALHDKLGHSINGSIYQLEAAKLLVQKKPEECKRILQLVIDQLRLSMDEIRMILRRERPDKKRMALLSLQSLCHECEDQYQIKTKLVVEDEQGVITEKVWEVILDNTYEAVTNALKYSKCKNIEITIIAMNEVVRCTIKDDGVGAKDMEEGMGIAGMKNRVRAIKGVLTIESEFGFSINMILPIT